MVVGPDNTSIYTVCDLCVYKVAPGGAVTTVLSSLPIGLLGCWNDLDETGDLLVGTGWAGKGALMRVDRSTGAVLATYLQNRFPNAFCLNRGTGEIIVGDVDPVAKAYSLLRVTRDGVVTTITRLPDSIYAIDYHPGTGDVLIGVGAATWVTSPIYRLDRSNRLSTLAWVSFPATKALAVLADGTIAAGGNQQSKIFRLSSTGTVLGTLHDGVTLGNVAMCVAGENKLWGLGPAVVGGTFNISVRFEGLGGKAYVTGASFGSHPGIRIGARRIPLNLDNLLVATFQVPQVFGRFVGVLDRSDSARPFIRIPNIAALRGQRIFLAAAVVDISAPFGLAGVSQEFGVTIQ